MTDSLHVLFSDEGHPVAIRKWSQEPFDDAVEYVRKSDIADLIAKADKMATSCEGMCDKTEALIAACDQALNWADANARWFDISTAPDEGDFIVWNASVNDWCYFTDISEFRFCADREMDEFTHWRKPLPPPSSPPLPEPLERLGEVLRRVKGVS